MKHPKIPLAQTVIQLCKAKNIQHIVLSPGSRNAPLTIGFTHDSFFNCYSIVDERCAAFFALGTAQQLQEPVAVVCTSGSALLNYYPAVAEAYYSNISLVVLSADRPKHLVGIGDGQTINQEHVYKNHILYSANLKEDLSVDNWTEDEGSEMEKTIQQTNEAQINKALNISSSQKGPVHINIPLNEPLYERVDALSVNPKVIPLATEETPEIDYAHLAKDWNASKRKLVLVGVNEPNRVEQKYLDRLAHDESVLVMTEATSNIHHKRFIPSIDKLIGALNASEFKALKPDIVLTFGGLIVSKKIKKFLREYPPMQHWHVGTHTANDTFFKLNKVFKMPLNTFFSAFLPKTESVKSDYTNFWLNEMASRREKHEKYMAMIPFSDFKAFDVLLNSMPNDVQCQVGNSSAIRYVQLFDLNPMVQVFCNRGTSGIDGSTSTAIGAALASKKQTVCVTGDLSFFYDSNALWNNHIPKDFRIIVVNNNGGGIFRILPGHKNTENFDTYFETTHHLKAQKLCELYDFEYSSATNENELKSAFSDFYHTSSRPKLLEIFTPKNENDQILLNYFKFIK
ncbi:2-succinyl-5-enolpyruvyl-6-hydroxy-3-cyclohexene-1-carboxylic-acid synthase [Lacinutrix sp. Hel_I_90]|uniref:2-succinyl-5-enolpyruvyl-6-hydroxy-3- cyclohexene-1-carboxylic-acid synthase n=1 Tax=Lacinutrix sp. Hel_I_90 TaxID=1249999 RepID=UPI0005CA2AC8|nr:2-succinyl-5-enolpyruvyl-6-hydroxy-3-cyclohexene-1-carboxylic-acid synthase [Lacinutrix sp. Hel_I_90]